MKGEAPKTDVLTDRRRCACHTTNFPLCPWTSDRYDSPVWWGPISNSKQSRPSTWHLCASRALCFYMGFICDYQCWLYIWVAPHFCSGSGLFKILWLFLHLFGCLKILTCNTMWTGVKPMVEYSFQSLSEKLLGGQSWRRKLTTDQSVENMCLQCVQPQMKPREDSVFSTWWGCWTHKLKQFHVACTRTSQPTLQPGGGWAHELVTVGSC